MKALRNLFLSVILVLVMVSSAFAVANTCTSTTGVAAGSDPTFTVTYKTHATTTAVTGVGTIAYVNYTKGGESGITLTFDVLNPSLSAADVYRLYGVNWTTGAVGVVTVNYTATGKYMIPLPVYPSQSKVIMNVVFGTANQGGAVVVQFMEP